MAGVAQGVVHSVCSGVGALQRRFCRLTRQCAFYAALITNKVSKAFRTNNGHTEGTVVHKTENLVKRIGTCLMEGVTKPLAWMATALRFNRDRDQYSLKNVVQRRICRVAAVVAAGITFAGQAIGQNLLIDNRGNQLYRGPNIFNGGPGIDNNLVFSFKEGRAFGVVLPNVSQTVLLGNVSFTVWTSNSTFLNNELQRGFDPNPIHREGSTIFEFGVGPFDKLYPHYDVNGANSSQYTQGFFPTSVTTKVVGEESNGEYVHIEYQVPEGKGPVLQPGIQYVFVVGQQNTGTLNSSSFSRPAYADLTDGHQNGELLVLTSALGRPNTSHFSPKQTLGGLNIMYTIDTATTIDNIPKAVPEPDISTFLGVGGIITTMFAFGRATHRRKKK